MPAAVTLERSLAGVWNPTVALRLRVLGSNLKIEEKDVSRTRTEGYTRSGKYQPVYEGGSFCMAKNINLTLRLRILQSTP